jgi:hypothetical protein
MRLLQPCYPRRFYGLTSDPQSAKINFFEVDSFLTPTQPLVEVLMTTRTPYIIVRLSPEGKLCMEQSAPNGGRRLTPLTNLNQLRIILSAQLTYSPQTIGLDGAPTNAQARHWAQHCGSDSSTIIFEDPDCPWCLASRIGVDTSKSAFYAAKRELKRQRIEAQRKANPHRMGDGTVVVRTLKPRGKAARLPSNKKSSLDLDFSDLGI